MDMTEAAAQRLAQDPRVAYVEQDGIITGAAVTVQTVSNQWGLDRIDQRGRSTNAEYRYAADGAGVNVYVLDSGIRVTHEDFGGRAFAGFDGVYDGRPSNQDCHGHGTHVAGIIGGAQAGVAKAAWLYSVRVLGCDNTGTWSGFIAGVDWVVANHHSPAVINASINGGYLTSVHQAVQRAVSTGISVVVAAGNEASDACRYFSGIPEAITVASTDNRDLRAAYSNFGPCVDLFAPGSGILSLSNGSDGGYATMSGTSMAAPHVAGGVALYLQHHSSAGPEEVRAALRSAATRNAVGNGGAASPNRLLFTTSLGDVKAPALSITAPAAGATLSGTATVAATSSDDVEMRELQFRLSGIEVGRDATAPYSLTFDTTKYSNGSHLLEVIAIDTAGNAMNRRITVTIGNSAAATTTTGWSPSGIGTGGGQAAYSAAGLVIDARGSDLWGSADNFEFAHRTWTGDGDLTAYVASIARPSDAAFAMAGVMFRESLAPGSRYAALVIGTDGKLKFRRRTQPDGATSSSGPATGTTYAPRWLKLSRRGSTFTAYTSTDARTWAVVHVPETLPLPATLEVGTLALRSGGAGVARATFSHVGIARLPDGWTGIDMGAVGAPGRADYASGVWHVNGGGTDLWGTKDAAHFVYHPWSGDVEITAKVQSIAAPSGSTFALAGLSIRESLAPDARHASIIVTTQGKAKFRRRLTAGGSTLSDGPTTGAISIPVWLRLRRTGQSFSAFISSDGESWEQVHTTQSVPLSPSAYVGIVGLRGGGTAVGDVRITNLTVR